MSEKIAPFALCPVHDGSVRFRRVWEVAPGRLAICGKPGPVHDFFAGLGVKPEDGPYAFARPELGPDAPGQFMIVQVRIAGGSNGYPVRSRLYVV